MRVKAVTWHAVVLLFTVACARKLKLGEFSLIVFEIYVSRGFYLSEFSDPNVQVSSRTRQLSKLVLVIITLFTNNSNSVLLFLPSKMRKCEKFRQG